jgi:hypothetical protein
MLAAMGRDGTPGAIALGDRVPRLELALGRSGWLCPRILGGLAGAAAALGCAALVAVSGAGTGRAPAARHGHGLSSLPAAAQGPIAAALGRDQPAYRVSGLHAVNPAQGLRVGFSHRGVTVASGGAQLGLALSAYGYASALQPLASAAPRVSANRVSYSHGILQEWFANGPLGLEQGFDLAARPRSGSGPLTFSLVLSGDLAASLHGGSLLLSGPGVALRYGGLVVTDARGRVLHAWLELAGGHLLIRVDDRGAVYPLRIDPLIQQAELTAKEGAEEEELGTSVAVSGSTIVVGAPNRRTGGDMERGAAYVFSMPSSGWANATQTAELTTENGKAGERFGQAVAVSVNTIVVGAPDHEVGVHNEQGTSYVFVKPASGWVNATQTAELTAEKGEAEEFLGSSVAISGNTVIAGAPRANVLQGAAYIFTQPGGGWGSKEADEKVTQKAKLTASDGLAGDQLGFAVALSGATAVAGAPHDEVGVNSSQGAAYVFSQPGDGWGSKEIGEIVTQAAKLTASDGAADNELGQSVGISATTVVAGAPLAKVGSNMEQGKAYVFTEPGGGWGAGANPQHEAAELIASDGAAGDQLGFSVAVFGQTIAAAAPGAKIGSNMEQGAAYVFGEPSGGWTGTLHEDAKLTADNGSREDRLGESVAVSGDTVLAGSPRHKVGANEEQGAAYVFEEPPSVSISAPVNGATYTQGQVVAAEYSCSTAPGTTVTCSGPVSPGAAVETGTPGVHTFTISATDSDALNASQSVSYTVVAAPVTPVATPLAPILSGLSESAKTWREGSLLAQISGGKGKKRKPPVGTTFSFTLNEPASVTFKFTEPAGGRRVGKQCVAQTNKNKHKRRCTRTVIAGTLTFSGHAGANKLRFEGLISKHRKLKPGSYTLLVTATASGKHSTTRTLRFTIAA